MREIRRKSNKSELFSWILIVVLTVISLISSYVTIQRFQEQYESLVIEVTQLEKQKQELIDIKEELLNHKQSLEDRLKEVDEENENLLYKVELLEEEVENLRTIRAKLTAYSPLDNRDGQQAEGNPSRTSIGRQVGKYIVAADPKKLPYGTKLEIPNWGVVEVADTGGALRKDNKNIRIDVFKDTYPEAMKFGAQDMDVKILEWGGD